MKLNLEFMKSNEISQTDNSNKELINEVMEYTENYNIVDEKEEKKIPSIALSDINENVLNWYTFKKESSILELNADFGQITGMLCSKASRVVSVEKIMKKCEIIAKRNFDKCNLEVICGDFLKIDLNEEFDYIIYTPIPQDFKMIGDDTFNKIKKFLKPTGKIIFRFENPFGMRNWTTIHDNVNVEKLITNSRNSNIDLITKDSIIEKMIKNGFINHRTFYPFPSHKFTNVIFSDRMLPDEHTIDKYFNIYGNNDVVLMNEIEMYKNILRYSPESFELFVNYFLIEASLDSDVSDYKYISFNNYRKEEFKLITIIREDEVVKKEVSIKGKNHLDNFKSNLKYIKNYDFEILDHVSDNDELLSEYIKDMDTYDNIIYRLNIEDAIETLKDFSSKLKLSSKTFQESDFKTIIDKYKFADTKLLERLNYLEYGFWDMTFKNCFYIDNKYYFFDQEWMEKWIPMEFLIYRNVINCYEFVKKVNVDTIFEQLGILEYIEFFKMIDENLRKEIIDYNLFEFLTKKNYIDFSDNYLKQNEYEKFVLNQRITGYENELTKVKDIMLDLEENNKRQNEYIQQMEEELKKIRNSFIYKLIRPVKNIYFKKENNRKKD